MFSHLREYMLVIIQGGLSEVFTDKGVGRSKIMKKYNHSNENLKIIQQKANNFIGIPI